jgi:sialic acid synthase
MKEAVRLKSGRGIGSEYPVFVVAEVGNNHQGDLDTALEMVRVAAACGVDAVKFQKRCTTALLTAEGRRAPYCGVNSLGKTYGEHRDALELSVEDMAQVKALADELGLVFFASAWDAPSLDEMASLGVELLKISSADLVSVPLLRRAAALNLPIILSTGMSDLPEIDSAVNEILKHHDNIVILHCNSTYPCPEEQIGLPVIAQLRRRYKVPVGYSGHEQGLGPSVAAVALGACVVERHFTLDKNAVGTDHKASLEPNELAALVVMVREVEKSMMVEEKQVYPSEVATAKKLRKSIVYTRDLPAGHVLTEADLAVKCPGSGVSPVYWDDVEGAVLKIRVRCEESLSWDQLTPAGSKRARTISPGGKTAHHKV